MSSCGCDGNNNLNILNNQMPQNGLMPNNGPVQSMNNMPMVNSPMVSLQPMQVQQQPVMVNTTEPIGPINSLVKGELVEEKVVDEPVVNDHVKELKLLLCIILALATHDAVKFFISQSIRLNRGSSSRFIYYPVVVLGALILLNLF
jgi:hypothetical protein